MDVITKVLIKERSRELATVGHAREDFSEEAGGKQQIGVMLEGATSHGMLAASGYVWICICFLNLFI